MSWWWPSKILSHSGTVLRIHISRADFQSDKKGLSQSQIFTLTSDIITPYTQRKNNQCALEIFFPTIRNELSFIKKKDDEVVIQSSKANNFIFSISYFIQITHADKTKNPFFAVINSQVSLPSREFSPIYFLVKLGWSLGLLTTNWSCSQWKLASRVPIKDSKALHPAFCASWKEIEDFSVEITG